MLAFAKTNNVSISQKWINGTDGRVKWALSKARLVDQAAAIKLLLRNVPKVKNGELCSISTDNVSLNLGFKIKTAKVETPPAKATEKTAADEDDNPTEHTKMTWSGRKPWEGQKPTLEQIRGMTLISGDPGNQETTFTLTPKEVQEAMAAVALGEPYKNLEELLSRDDHAKIKANQQLSKGCFESIARSKQARINEQRSIAQLDRILTAAGRPLVGTMQKELVNLASLTSEKEVLAAVATLKRVAPVLMFAYFNTVYRQERRKLVLAKRRFAEQVVKSLIETAKPPQAPASGGPAPLWRPHRVQVEAFSATIRNRMHRIKVKPPPGPRPPGVPRPSPPPSAFPNPTIIAMGSWGGNTGMRGMQRAAGNFPRKMIERLVEVIMTFRFPNVFFGTIDEYATSKRLGKLRVSLTQQRVDKWNPTAGTKAYVKRANGSEDTFDIVQDKKHKLMAFGQRFQSEGGKEIERIIVTGRDPPTSYTFSQVTVHNLLGLARPHHLSRRSTFMTLSPNTTTTQTSGRGHIGHGMFMLTLFSGSH